MLDTTAKFCLLWGMEKPLDFVLERLPEYRGRFKEVAIGSGVSYSWVSKLANNRIPNPGIRSVERLADWINSQPTAPPSVASPAD